MNRQVATLGVGDRIPSITKRMTREKMVAFENVRLTMTSEGPPSEAPNNVHTSDERAREMGLRAAIASGQMSFSYLHEMLARCFGDGFTRGGMLALTFVKPVMDGDTVVANGVVKSKEPVQAGDGKRQKYVLDVWLERTGGEKTASGTAEAFLRE